MRKICLQFLICFTALIHANSAENSGPQISNTWEISSENNSKAEAKKQEVQRTVPRKSETLAEKLARIQSEKFAELDGKKIEKKEEPKALAKAQISETQTPEAQKNIAENILESEKTKPSNLEEEINNLEKEKDEILKKIKERKESFAKSEAEKEFVKTEVKAEEFGLSPEALKRKSEEDKLIEKLKAEIAKTENAPKEPEIELVKAEKFYTESSGFFHISSTNSRAADLGASLVKSVEEAYGKYFGKNLNLKNKTFLTMLTADEAEFEGYFKAEIGKDIFLYVKCDVDLPLDKFAEFISDAYLKTLMHAMSETQAKAPFWMQLALRTALAQNISIGMTYEMARYASANPPDNLSDVLAYNADSKTSFEQMESSAYWALEALYIAFEKSGNFENVMRKTLVGENLETALLPIKTAYGENFDSYFRVLMTGEITSKLAGIKSFEDSDNEVLMYCSILKTRDEETPEAIFDTEIFERRNEIKAQIEIRILEIKLAIPWLNPVYFNTAVALGRVYQAALDSSLPDFQKARTDFLAELKKSREVANRARQILKN